jgi:two-component system chemotaxis response regulator CheY
MKALIVDDDIVSRMALVDLLSAYGMVDLAEAEDGAAAWRLLEEGLRPAICFCDVRMPRMTGIDLLERMKADPALAEVPFVLVSSASDRDTVLQAVTLGAVGYILKPLHAAEARAHLDKIFRITLDKLAEDPAATLARLHIGAERLAAYLAAFGEQLASARSDLAAAPGADVDDSTRRRLDGLHAGCVTLGLWQCAAQLDRARAGAGPEEVGRVLADTGDAVASQLHRLRAGPAGLAASGEGAPP